MRAKANIRVEAFQWGFTDKTVDPGEVLLRLVTQSAARAAHYADLLQQAYEAAERLKEDPDGTTDAVRASEDGAYGRSDQARADLDRIFNTGGVSALVGLTWGAAKDVGVYATGEAIRGLADLEMRERKLCADFASKAIAAGLNERMVRVAERQGEMLAAIVTTALAEVSLPPELAMALKASIARQVRELGSS